MPGKVATIGDLFTPLNTISNCIENNGGMIGREVQNVNNSVLNCYSALKNATESFGTKFKDGKDEIISSIQELTEVSKKSADANYSATGATATTMAGLGSSISGGLESLSGIGIGIGQELTLINENLLKLKKFLILKYLFNERKANKAMAGGASQKKIKAPDIKLPKIENADSVGKGIEAMVEAVKTVSKMSLIRLMMFRPKMHMLISSIEKPAKQFQKTFKPGEIKYIGDSLQSLAKGLSDYVGNIGKVIDDAKNVTGIGKHYKDSELYKVLNGTIIATIIGMYGGTYNAQTNKITGKDTKRLANIKTASRELGLLGRNLSSFAKDMKKVGLNAMVAGIFFNKNPMKGSLYKIMNGAVVAIMTAMYGSKYNAATNTLTGGSPKRMQELSVGIRALKHLGDNTFIFIKSLAKSLPLMPLAYLATLMFDKTTKGVRKGIDEFVGRGTTVEMAAKKYNLAARTFKKLGKSISEFNALLALSFVTAPFAFLGTVLLGNTVGNIKRAKQKLFGKTPGLVAKTEYGLFGDALKDLGRDIMLFNLALSVTAVTAPLAYTGSLMLPLIVKGVAKAKRTLFGKLGSVVGAVEYGRFGKTLHKLGRDILAFEVAMALSAVVAPVAMVGMAMFALLMLETKLVFNHISNPKATLSFRQASKSLRKIAWSILAFEVSMVFSTILVPVAAVGLVGASALLIGASMVFQHIGKPKARKNIAFGALGLQLMAVSTLGFIACMVLSSMLVRAFLINDAGKLDPTNVVALAGTFVMFGLMVGSFYVFKHIGKAKNVKNVFMATLSIMLMCASFIMFSISMLVGTMVTKQILGGTIKSGKLDPTDVVGIAGSVGLFFLMLGAHAVFKKIGKARNVNNAIRAGVAIMCMSGGFLLFSLSLWVADKFTRSMYKKSDGKFDVMGVINQVVIFALMMGSLKVFNMIGSNKSVKESFRGLMSIAFMSVGFILFSGSVWVADKIIGSMWKTSGGGTDWIGMLKTVAVFGMMIGGVYLYDFAGKRIKNVAKGLASILIISAGLVGFSFGVKHLADALKGADMKTLVAMPVLMVAFIGEFILAGKFVKDIAKGSVAIGIMSPALAAFGWGVGKYVEPVKDMKWGDIAKMAALMGIFGLEFAGLGFLMTQILMADVAIGVMGPALASLGWGVGKYVEPIKDMKWGEIAKMAALIGILGLEFAALGPLSIGIVASDVAFGVMGPALTMFGRGLAEFMKPIHDLKPNTIKDMAKVIGVLGGEFALIGLAALSIGAADLVMGGMGKSLSSLGRGLAVFIPPVQKLKSSQVQMMGTVINTLADAFKDIGLIGAVPLKSGAKAMKPVSEAITLLSKSLQEWSKVKIDKNSLDMLCMSIDRIKLAFQGQPKGKSENKKGGFLKKLFKSISGAITAPFDKAQIRNTAQGISASGDAIKTLSKGLQEWSKVRIDTNSLDKLCLSVDRIKIAFGSVPKETVKLPGILGRMGVSLKVPMNVNAIKTTAKGLIVAGVAIRSLTKGLSMWTESGIEVDDIASLSKVLIIMKDTFAVIVSANAEHAKYMKDVLGCEPSSLTSDEAERGASFVKKIGESLIDITKGLVSFKNDFSNEFNDPNEIEGFAQIVANVVTSLTTAFQSVGMAEKEMPVKKASTLFGRLWQDLTVNTFGPKTKNYVKEGIASVNKLGSTIKDIAVGLKEFKDIVPKNADTGWVAEVGTNIAALLDALYVPLKKFGTTDESWDYSADLAANGVRVMDGALLAVANSAKKTVNFNKHKTDVMSAIKNIGGLGDFIEGIANGLKTIGEMNTKTVLGEGGVVNDDFTVTGGSGAIGNVQKLMCAVIGGIVVVGNKMAENGTYEDIQVIQNKDRGFFEKMSGTGRTSTISNGKKSYLGMAVDGMVKVGEILSGMAEGLKAMNEVYKDPSKLVGGAVNIMSAVAVVTSMLGVMGECMRDGKTRNLTSSGWSLRRRHNSMPEIWCNGNVKRLADDSVDIDGALNIVKSTLTKTADGLKSINGQSEVLGKIYNDPSMFMLPVLDIIQMATAFADHVADDKFCVRGNGLNQAYRYRSAMSSDIMNSASKNSAKIKNIASEVVKTVPTIGNSMEQFRMLYDNAEPFVFSIANLQTVIGLLSDHNADTEFHLYGNGKYYNYKANAFNKAMCVSASSNSKYINNMSKQLVPALTSISSIPKNAGAAFETFATQLANGMNKLSAVGSITNATAFVNALSKAKDKGTFESLSSNTERIANAINQINNDIMSPYAAMIGALRDLLKISSSKRDQLYNELYELVEKIITAINDGHKPKQSTPKVSSAVTTSSTKSNGGGNGGGNGSANRGTTASSSKPVKLEGVDKFKKAVDDLVAWLDANKS